MCSSAMRRWRLREVHAVSCLCSFLAIAFTADTASGGIAESRLAIGPDGVEFDLREVPRREVLERLFAGLGIKLEWGNRAVADDPIKAAVTAARDPVWRASCSSTRTSLLSMVGSTTRAKSYACACSEGLPAESLRLVLQHSKLRCNGSPTGGQPKSGLPAPVAKPKC